LSVSRLAAIPVAKEALRTVVANELDARRQRINNLIIKSTGRLYTLKSPVDRQNIVEASFLAFFDKFGAISSLGFDQLGKQRERLPRIFGTIDALLALSFRSLEL
jgi:hypothetical protein